MDSALLELVEKKIPLQHLDKINLSLRQRKVSWWAEVFSAIVNKNEYLKIPTYARIADDLGYTKGYVGNVVPEFIKMGILSNPTNIEFFRIYGRRVGQLMKLHEEIEPLLEDSEEYAYSSRGGRLSWDDRLKRFDSTRYPRHLISLHKGNPVIRKLIDVKERIKPTVMI